MASSDSTDDSAFQSAIASIARRWRLWVAGATLLALGWAAGQVWRHASVTMREDPRYRVTAANIETPPTPPWIRTDIRLEALRDADLRGGLSLLDPPDRLQKRLAEAFAFHPWVERVGIVTKRPPDRIAIDLSYRRPLAVVQRADPQSELVPVDVHAVRLPSGDLNDTELRSLPRVVGVDSATRVGEVWRDMRVEGAVLLVEAFGARWAQLGIVKISPHRHPEIYGELRYPVFDLITAGGTRIVWGAPPHATPPGEPSFAAKLSELERFVAEQGPIDTNRRGSPGVIDLRDGITTQPRSAKRSDPAARTAAKPDEAKASAVK